MQRQLHFILDVEVGTGQEPQQFRHVRRHLGQQVRFPQHLQERQHAGAVGRRRRRWRGAADRQGRGRSLHEGRRQGVLLVGQCGRQEQLRPQAFPR